MWPRAGEHRRCEQQPADERGVAQRTRDPDTAIGSPWAVEDANCGAGPAYAGYT